MKDFAKTAVKELYASKPSGGIEKKHLYNTNMNCHLFHSCRGVPRCILANEVTDKVVHAFSGLKA